MASEEQLRREVLPVVEVDHSEATAFMETHFSVLGPCDPPGTDSSDQPKDDDRPAPRET
eukprot:CAMPEP_0118902498 /NCGR_PEP_ID=MMETSP1166-20130328/7756_1 /TAXON_ID=1104430 /ORGANISM="Chrysoreinhardia sp, Strain CCMP3193" /LENGTH=58 /DNA_ID=CAMNT_0006841705 /DNA_START=146 /DNA_END=322 /DNA_ORIENTATION=+